MAYLHQQNEAGSITDTEHQELLVYVDRVELLEYRLVQHNVSTFKRELITRLFDTLCGVDSQNVRVSLCVD